jgi:hypothetical protein
MINIILQKVNDMGEDKPPFWFWLWLILLAITLLIAYILN